jgi:single-stranded-DNA-specific exonuclease
MGSSPLSLTGARWEATHVDADALATLVDRGLHPVTARCMAARQPADSADATAWLTPHRDHLLDPAGMLGMAAAVERVRRAAADGHRVRIITDYDVDGTTSSLILQATLRRLGVRDVSYHIPDRFDEGYGFSVRAADTAADDGMDLIVTADIGVRDHASVARARERGVEVLICDHHLPAGAQVPEGALVLCPPQTGCDYANPHLAACGVALKLAQALLAGTERADVFVGSLLKLAAIGTVADLVPLSTLENRAIVALGLQSLNTDRHSPGLAALMHVAGLEPGKVTERDLGFRIGPRINAAGRVASARLVVRLLTSRDPVEARALARQLDQLNSHRKQLQTRLTREVLGSLKEPPDPFVVIAGPEPDGWHRGVVGIVASRVKDEVHRPVAVVSIQGELAVGSVRSVPAIHAVRALESASDLLVKFGGHPAAAGFTVRASDLDALRERLCAYVTDAVHEDAMVPVRRVDAEVDAELLSDDLHGELRSLGPFGMGNPEPRLMVRGVRPRRVRTRADGRLLSLELPGPGGRTVDAVWWGQGELEARFRDASVDLLGSLSTWRWRGEERLQFNVKDARFV